MTFNSNQGYAQQPFAVSTGPHNPMPFTQLRSYGALTGMRYGSFARTTLGPTVRVTLSGGGDSIRKSGGGDRARKSGGGGGVRITGEMC